MRIGELRGIEALVVAPDFAPDLDRDLVVDRVGQVLRCSVSAGLRGVIMGVVEVGNGSQFVGDLPGRGDRVEVTKVVIVAWRFRTNVRGSRHNKLLFIEMQPN